MTMRFYLLTIILTLWLGLTHGQSGQVQVFHNSADTSMKFVDVWLDGTKWLDNFSFRSATAPIEIPTGQLLHLTVQDSSSIDTLNPLISWVDSIPENEKLLFVIQGLSDPMGYSSYQPFELNILSTLQDSAAVSGNTDILIYNGCTDITAMNITETREGLGAIYNNVTYGSPGVYEAFTTSNYRFQLSLPDNTAIGEYDLALASNDLEDSAMVVFTSGFLNPDSNRNGAELRLLGLLPSGTVINFDMSRARVQLIHNSADPSISSVDIYANGDLILDDFDFRASTGYLNFPSSRPIELAIANESSTAVGDAFFTQQKTFEADQTYVGIVAGNEDEGFSTNHPIEIFFQPSRREALVSNNTDILFFHGSTDVGTVEIFESAALEGNIVSPKDFGEFENYTSLPFTDYQLSLIREVDNSILAKYDFILSLYNLKGKSITLMTSGFADTAANNDGENIDLWFARSSSGLMTKLPLALGVQDSKYNQDHLMVYPQPAQHEMHIQATSPLGEIEILNLQGQRLMKLESARKYLTISTADLAAGSYLIRTNHQGVFRHRTFVIQP